MHESVQIVQLRTCKVWTRASVGVHGSQARNLHALTLKHQRCEVTLITGDCTLRLVTS